MVKIRLSEVDDLHHRHTKDFDFEDRLVARDPIMQVNQIIDVPPLPKSKPSSNGPNPTSN